MYKYRYIPILKTTDAELKAYSYLSDKVKDEVLPLFELTKARRTKKDTYGEIRKRISKLQELTEGRAFILDLTVHEDLINYQIEDLLEPHDGFENWRKFLSEFRELKIVPMIHVDTDDLSQTSVLVEKLKDYDTLALKVEYFDSDVDRYLDAIYQTLREGQELVILIDGGFIEEKNYQEVVTRSRERISELQSRQEEPIVAISSSSFPKSVPKHTSDCHDHMGRFPKLELDLYNELCQSSDCDLVYSDYASVHPVRYNTGGGTWVPRVDFPLWDHFIYTRYRRGDGGYERAAKAMIQHSEYSRIDCWGCDEIETAASSGPNGLSPSYWISVRVNIHVTRQALGIT